ncbi:MAG: gliding motility lipoprotein GldH [Bacteroidetes bacterium]|nr:gliding motility lipoprotein GldH [Bacteroidota bacterium]
MNRLLIISLIFLVYSLESCDTNRVFEKNTKIKDYVWMHDQKITFEVEITDTATLYNIYINVRHTGSYPMQNLWVKIETIFPTGKALSQELSLPLAEKTGKWLGDGLGDIWDRSIMIQENAYFDETGLYTFNIEQNTRRTQLWGVMDIGLRIEKAATDALIQDVR